jgi:hypothetical protein
MPLLCPVQAYIQDILFMFCICRYWCKSALAGHWWTPLPNSYTQFPTMDNDIMEDARTREVGQPLPECSSYSNKSNNSDHKHHNYQSNGNAFWVVKNAYILKCPGRGKILFFYPIASRPALGPTQHSIQWEPGAISLRVKRPGPWSWPLTSI